LSTSATNALEVVQSRAIVEGLNIVTKHKKPDNKNPQGSIVEIEAGNSHFQPDAY
jgi:ribosomal protein L24